MCGKMAEELLSLKWNNHQAHFVDILTFLREQEIFVDATLACGGKLYAAHKFVLSTCSDYFKQMFTKNPSKHPIVFMKDVTSRDLEALLDFMYNGEVNVPQSSLGSLIKTAEGLQIKGLAVPDDPPAPKRERDREKRENRTQLDHHHHHSPPAKRPRPRERSPPHTSPSQQSSVPVSSSSSQVSRSRSPPPPIPPVGASQINMPPVEATLDEDSRTSVQSGVSGLSEQNSSTTPSLSSKQQSGSTSSQVQHQPPHNPDDTTHQDPLTHGHTGGEEPSPGPSGLHKPQQPQQSKEEPEFEIKQEDVVELGEDDEGDWGVEGDGGGGESSVGADNPPNFPEVMLPQSDGSMPPTGDPAMRGFSGGGGGGFGGVGDEEEVVKVLVDKAFCLATPFSYLSPDSGSGQQQQQQQQAGFGCRVCGQVIQRRDNYRRHMRLHSGQLPFQCHLCPRRFNTRYHLHYHLYRSTVHANEHSVKQPSPSPPPPPPPADDA